MRYIESTMKIAHLCKEGINLLLEDLARMAWSVYFGRFLFKCGVSLS